LTVPRRRFGRALGQRRYKKLFLIATEGKRTEPDYFGMFGGDSSVVRVVCLNGKRGSSPLHVLRRMTDHLQVERLKSSDEAWLVIDRDNWTQSQLAELHRWSLQRINHGLAISNPSFEFWLLLHFEHAVAIDSTRHCVDRLRRWIRDYDKGFDAYKITRQQVEAAIERAKSADHSQVGDWPRSPGQTTVYRLVERILNTIDAGR